MKAFLPLLAATAIAPCALAQGADDSGWYAGIGYEFLQEKDGPQEYQAIGLTGGYNINRYFGAELTAAFGVEGEDTFQPETSFDNGAGGTNTIPSIATSAELSHRIDLMGVGRLPVTDRISLVGKAGVSHYQYDYSFRVGATDTAPGGGYSTSPKGYGFSAGVGAEMALTDRISLSGGYDFHAEQGVFDGDVEGFQIGVKRRF